MYGNMSIVLCKVRRKKVLSFFEAIIALFFSSGRRQCGVPLDRRIAKGVRRGRDWYN